MTRAALATSGVLGAVLALASVGAEVLLLGEAEGVGELTAPATGLGVIGVLYWFARSFLAAQRESWASMTRELTAAMAAQQTEHSRETAALREQMASQDQASREGWTAVSHQLDGLLARCLAR